MDEGEAKAWLRSSFDVPRETFERLEAFAELIAVENAQQNLVARSTLPQIWSRHIADSAQLLLLAPGPGAHWLDLGSGPGFPGLVIAALHDGPVTLVEERRIRCAFLERARQALGLEARVTIQCQRVERLEQQAHDVISARAFAPLDRLFHLSLPFARKSTRWVLPKGKNAKSELEAVRASWQGAFSLEPSLTDPDAQIIVAEAVRRRT
jgi:16S rRNA (guanine527-N7)-methyltransferase